MRVAEAAGNGGADHAQADIGVFSDIFFGYRRPEAWPAGARVEFGAGVEERGVAADAAENSFGVIIGIFVGVGALGPGVARNFERIGRELFAPLFVCLDDLGGGDGVL